MNGMSLQVAGKKKNTLRKRTLGVQIALNCPEFHFLIKASAWLAYRKLVESSMKSALSTRRGMTWLQPWDIPRSRRMRPLRPLRQNCPQQVRILRTIHSFPPRNVSSTRGTYELPNTHTCERHPPAPRAKPHAHALTRGVLQA